jgi:hypothetical protein
VQDVRPKKKKKKQEERKIIQIYLRNATPGRGLAQPNIVRAGAVPQERHGWEKAGTPR